MTRTPEEAVDFNLRPYLAEDFRTEDDIKELSYSLRRRYSNWVDPWVRDRQRVHLWEKVYRFHKEASPLVSQRCRPKITFKYPPFFTR